MILTGPKAVVSVLNNNNAIVTDIGRSNAGDEIIVSIPGGREEV